MSEFERKQDPHDDCMHCDKQYNLTTSNTCIFRYEDIPDAEHLNSICPHCSGINSIFLGSEDTKEHFAQFGYGVYTQPVPNFEVMKMYLELYDIPLKEEQPISPRQDARVQWLGYLLSKELLIADDFNGKNELYI